MRRLWRVGALGLAFAFMAVLMAKEWEKLSGIEWVLRPSWFYASLVGIVLILFLNAWGWHLILRALDQNIPVSRSLHIWLVSSLARYIPGGVWSYANRVSLAKNEGVGLAAVTSSLYFEAFLASSSSLVVGMPVLFDKTPTAVSLGALLGFWFVSSMLLHPRVIKLATLLPGRIGRVMRGLPVLSLGRVMALYFYYLMFWLIMGAVFVLFVLSLYPLEAKYWIATGLGFALAFFVGFVVVFAPGGLGVREPFLYLLLQPFISPSVALIVSLGSRLWLMCGELLTLVVLWLFLGAKHYWHGAQRR